MAVPRIRSRCSASSAAPARAGLVRGPRPSGAPVRNVERKAFHSLGLETDAERVEIKARFKELVKRHHPDANGGDRGSEDKLREIIEAYNYLKIRRLLLSRPVPPGG